MAAARSQSGKWFRSPIIFVGEIAILLMESVRRSFTRPFEVREIFSQMAFVGVSSVPIVALTSFASGAVLALYLSELLVENGGGELVGAVIGLSVTRELAPVIAGIMVAARCGSAMAAQIGTMAVTEQIDALRSLAVHPYNYLLVPRVLACLFMLPILGLVGTYGGMVGGLLVSASIGVPSSQFLRSVEVYLEPWDFVGGLYKTAAFGVIVALVSCQQGLRTHGGAVGVGRSTTNAVVVSMVLIYVANYFLAALFY
ncbi:MAG: putative phospholipid ABC transporter permease protein MlaE [Fimbriimonadales bacterium]|nr:MAG: ABC transporter permease [Armatimonadota bacterium]MBV6504296.1 putative phospholipid ABC transporter permease protein MlaE [Fimbriimonadales bacterium]MCE7900454.1 ABC transporter permease [Armatimonadetes bacterium ATM1]MDL1928345.1 ABC transporter permease [Fimbriimonadia bacterium ATM]MBC6969103.1 ABC transporter permease [Armatimonadota bacterium]